MDGNTDESSMDKEQPPLERKERKLKCFHLFNCDKTYKLDIVEKLLDAIKEKVTSFDISTATKKSFRLFEMSELCTTIRSGPPMDFAIFVVHANESRLSINEENAGIGYARFYKALQQATDDRVIVVIGGDDNYKGPAEEEGAILSRWAWRQISSQFKEEYKDGRKSFIFSWNKKHRAIHEEALLHFLDPEKIGQKFVHEPKRQPTTPLVDPNQEPKSQETSDAHADVQQMKDGTLEKRKAETGWEDGKKTEPVKLTQPATPLVVPNQEPKSKETSDVHAERKTEINSSDVQQMKDGTLKRQEAETGREQVSDHQSADRKKAELDEPEKFTHVDARESKPETAEKAENTLSLGKKIAILCRDQSDITIIKDLFGDEPLSTTVHIFSGSDAGAGAEFLLSTHSMRSCFIVVEAKTMKEEQFQDKPAGTPYENLLRTARKTVDKKVVIIVCNDKGNVSHNDEDVITNRIKQLLGDKGIIFWRKDSLHQTQNPQRDLHRTKSLSDYEAAAKSMEHDAHLINPEEFTLLLETRLRHGRISYGDEDVKQRLDGWTSPEYLAKNLLKDWKSTAEAELLIYGENKTGVINKVDVRAVKEDSKITQVTDGFKDAWQNVSGCFPVRILGKKRDGIPSRDPSDDLGLD